MNISLMNFQTKAIRNLLSVIEDNKYRDIILKSLTGSGNSQDIDRFSLKKFNVLKSYLDKNSLKGGFVRLDSQSNELCICTDNYSDDINSSSWKLLQEIIK